MLDGLSSLQLLGLVLVVIMMVVTIGVIGILLTEDKNISSSVIQACYLFCGRGDDLQHRGFGLFYYALVVISTVFACSVVGAEVMRRALENVTARVAI